MSIEYTWSLPANAEQFTVTSPKGVALTVISQDPASQLAHRFIGLWEAGGLNEAEDVVVRERRHFDEARQTLCHQIAFEISYGLVATVEELHVSLKDWRWAVADTVRGAHSWIEYKNDALDFQVAYSNGKVDPEHLVYVRPSKVLRTDYVAKRTEAVTVFAFARWLNRQDSARLFAMHSKVAEGAAAQRFNIRVSRRFRTGNR